MAEARILVVDDDASVLYTCSKALTRRGYRVEPAHSGPGAMERLRATEFDLLLTDIRMCGMNGLELLRSVREMDPQLATVVLTGYGTLPTAVEAFRLGVRGFLLKPFTLEELTTTVDDALERTRLLARERAAREQAEEARRRMAFLAEASERLSDSLDYTATLQRVAEMAVPTLADWCAVDVVDRTFVPRLVAVAHRDRAKEGLVREMRRQYSPDPLAAYGPPNVLRSGLAELHSRVEAGWPEASARDARHVQFLEALGVQACMYVPLRARGRILGVVTFAAEESERSYGPPELALAEDLAHRCALALDNARLYRALEDTLHAREAFVASVAHDLANPLTAIRGYAQLLRRQSTGRRAPTPEHVESATRQIEEQATTMADLLGELLDVARLEAGQRLRLDRQPTDLVALTRQAVAASRASSDKRRVRMVSGAPEVIGRWDAKRLRRVLDNVLSNALKYGRVGGAIIIHVGLDGDRAVVRITDDGVGIPEEDLPHLFERFHRARNVQDRPTGSGLGLWGAREIVEQHDGEIQVDSREGEGTTVTLWLPLGAAY